MKKKILAFILAAIMVIGMLPEMAFADDSNWMKLQGALAGTITESVSGLFEISGSTIRLLTDFTAEDGDTGLSVSGTRVLDLNGHVINANGKFAVITVSNGADLTIEDSNSEAIHYFTVGSNSVWKWDDSKTTGAKTIDAMTVRANENDVIAVPGGCITGGYAARGSGINTAGTGIRLTISRGNVIGNHSTGSNSSCGTVHLSSASLTMTGGRICGNRVENCGGGVEVANGASFQMNGGVISDNYANNNNGSGVQMNKGSFTMTGGLITRNYTVHTNSENPGGAVHMWAGTFTMTGGTITGNTAANAMDGAVTIGASCTATFGGTARIEGNTAGGVANNLYLYSGKTLTIATGNDAPKSGMRVGVTTAAPTESSPISLTGVSGTGQYSQYFSSDNASYTVVSGDDCVKLISAAGYVAGVTNGSSDTTMYNTLEAAVSAVNGMTDTTETGTVIRLFKDYSTTNKEIKIYNCCTIDLDGHTLSPGYYDNGCMIQTPLQQDGGITIKNGSLSFDKSNSIINTESQYAQVLLTCDNLTITGTGNTEGAYVNWGDEVLFRNCRISCPILASGYDSGGTVGTVTYDGNCMIKYNTSLTKDRDWGKEKIIFKESYHQKSKVRHYSTDYVEVDLRELIAPGYMWINTPDSDPNHTEYPYKVVKSKTVTLNLNNGTVSSTYEGYRKTIGDDTVYCFLDSQTLPTASQITRSGYIFGGWYDNADFTGSAVTSATEDGKTYYAKWCIAGVEHDGTTTYYDTLQKAVNVAAASDIVTLFHDTTENITVAAGKNFTLDLNGNVLQGTGSGSVITINSGAVLTLADSNKDVVHKGILSQNGYFWTWDGDNNTGETEIKGGIVTGGNGSNGGTGVYVANEGKLNLTAGTIAGNTHGNISDNTNSGAGVWVGGTFNMSGGAICYNRNNLSTSQWGGGVKVLGTFNMSGGTISHCESHVGGGVMVAGGEFNMSGTALIEDCRSNYGGGVHVQVEKTTGAVFNMSGGTIRRCESLYTSANGGGGGVIVNSVAGSVANITGGRIVNNKGANGGGVLNLGVLTLSGAVEISDNEGSNYGGVYSNGELTLGGTVKITGNKKGTGDNAVVSNVNLAGGKTILLGSGADAPAAGMLVGVTTATAPTEASQVAISGANDTDYHSYFFADRAMKEDVVYNSTDKKLYLAVPKLAITQTGTSPVYGTAMTADDDFFTVAVNGFGDAPTLKLEWKVTNGTTVSWSESAPTGITASFADQKISVATEATLNAGDYEFRITNGEPEKIDDPNSTATPKAQIANPKFVSAGGKLTVDKATLTVTAKDKSIDYGDAAANDGVEYSGFKNSDTEADLAGTLTYEYKDSSSADYTTASPVGNYNIIPSGLTSGNYEITFADGILTVNRKVIDDPSINSKVYTGETLTADVPSSEFYTVTRNDGGTAAGNYDVELTLKDTANYKWSDSDAVTRTLVFTITKEANSWIAEPAIADVIFGTAISPVYEAKFGNSSVVITYTGTGSTNYAGGTTAPTQAGTYKAAFTVEGTSDYGNLSKNVEFAIRRIAAEVTTVPEANTLTYNGQALTLVTAGVANGGTMQYKLGSDGVYTETVPTAVNAGTYTVYYKAAGDSNHTDTDEIPVQVTVSHLDITDAAVGAFAAMTYNGSMQMPAAAVTLGNLNVTGNWSSVTNVADTTTFTATGNFTGTIADKATGMAKAPVTVPALESKVYNGSLQTAEVPESGLYTVTANNGGTETGSYDVVLTLNDSSNYRWTGSAEAALTLKFEITARPKYAVYGYSDAFGNAVTADLRNAEKGAKVSLTISPATGYRFKSLTVMDTAGNTVDVAADNTFIMPGTSVTVNAVFEKYELPVGVIIQKNGDDEEDAGSGSASGKETDTGSIAGKEDALVFEDIDSVQEDAEAAAKAIGTAAAEGNTRDFIFRADEKTVTEQGMENKAYADAAAGEITEVTKPSETKSVTLDSVVMEALSYAEAKSLTVMTSVADVEFDAKTIEAISEQSEGDVRLVVTLVKEEIATDKGGDNKAEDNKVYYEVSLIREDGTEITGFNGGSISVTLPIPKACQNEPVVVVYSDGKGHYSPVAGRVNADGTYTFVTKHLSEYILMTRSEAEEKYNRIFDFGTLRPRAAERTEDSVTIEWDSYEDADGYIIYGSYCNHDGKTYRVKRLATIKDASVTAYTAENLESGTFYKFRVKAYKLVNGEKYVTVKSKYIHTATLGGKRRVTSEIELDRTGMKKNNTLSLKAGKNYTISAKHLTADGKEVKHVKLRYESTDKAVAVVTKKGTITAVGKGTCTVMVIAENGIYEEITVTVK